MPAVSVKQRRYMAMCEHDPQHVQGQCPDMTQQQFHDYASTSEAGLPKRAPRSLKHKMVTGGSNLNG